MGVCIFCERPAGFLSVVHKRCRMRRAAAVECIGDLFEPFLSASMRVEEFARLIEESAYSNLLQRHEMTGLVIAWARQARDIIDARRDPTPDENARAAEIVEFFKSRSTGELPRWVALWGHLDICSPAIPLETLTGASVLTSEPPSYLPAA